MSSDKNTFSDLDDGIDEVRTVELDTAAGAGAPSKSVPSQGGGNQNLTEPDGTDGASATDGK